MPVNHMEGHILSIFGKDKGSFKVKGGTKMHFSHPVIKDGKLYIRHDNSLFVYDIAKK